jgi:ankyrin repeat protein
VPESVSLADTPPARSARRVPRLAVAACVLLLAVGGFWKLQSDSAERTILNTALVRAVQNDDEREVRSLLERGADPNARNEIGEDGSFWSQLARVLRPIKRDSTGDTVIFEASQRNSSRVAQLLLQYGADPSARSWQGQTPLHSAAQWDVGDLVGILLQNGANPNLADDKKQTALHRAIEWENDGAVQKMLESGADVSRMDANGRTALALARTRHSPAIIKIIESHTAAQHMGTRRSE